MTEREPTAPDGQAADHPADQSADARRKVERPGASKAAPAGADLPPPFLFLRHGETDWNVEGRCQGQLDIALNALGRAQAERAAEALATASISRIVSSPLRRARNTADAVARLRGMSVEEDPGLKEVHLGAHQGELHAGWTPDFWRGRYDPPAGERRDMFYERSVTAILRNAARGPDVLIVAHGGLWRALRTWVSLDLEVPRMPNAIPIRVTPAPGAWRVEPLLPLPEVLQGGEIFGDVDGGAP
ncbi:MAG: histidine phosphatase family protein [Pseudomonadota bacterium]